MKIITFETPYTVYHININTLSIEPSKSSPSDRTWIYLEFVSFLVKASLFSLEDSLGNISKLSLQINFLKGGKKDF